MKVQYTPYTYLVGWSTLDRWYYGVEYSNHTGKVANPSNLWTTYFGTSKHLSEFRRINGEPDVIQVRKTFLTKEAACNWESKVLKRMNVIRDARWLNKTDNKGIVLDKFEDEHKKKISIAQKESWKRRLADPNFIHPAKGREGRKWTQEEKDTASSLRKGVKKPAGFSEKLSEAHKGKKKTPEHIAALAIAQRNLNTITNGTITTRINKELPIPEGFWVGIAPRPRVHCTHCDRLVDTTNIKRHEAKCSLTEKT